MIPENTELLAKIASGEASRDEIRSDLQLRCAEIPPAIWYLRFPGDLQIPLLQYMESTQLPENDSHDMRHLGKDTRHTIGHDVVENVLGRNGLILEKLVHYVSDGYDSEKRWPDEVLGEASVDRYREAYVSAVMKLEYLLKQAREKKLVFPGV